MPTIKERFKQGLHQTGTKLSNTVIGTPEERAERKQQNQQVKKARNKAHFKGRLAGAKEQAYQEGKRSAKNHGWTGTAKAVAHGMGQGLNVANSIIGFPVEQTRQPHKQKKRSKRSKKKQYRQEEDYPSFLF
jgi:hypothetical protein